MKCQLWNFNRSQIILHRILKQILVCNLLCTLSQEYVLRLSKNVIFYYLNIWLNKGHIHDCLIFQNWWFVHFPWNVLIAYVLNIFVCLKLLSLIKLFLLEWCNFLFVYTNNTWFVILNNPTRDFNLSYAFGNGIFLYIFLSVRFDNSCFVDTGSSSRCSRHFATKWEWERTAKPKFTVPFGTPWYSFIVYICWLYRQDHVFLTLLSGVYVTPSSPVRPREVSCCV